MSRKKKLWQLTAEDKYYTPIVVSYNERIRERKILESEDELDELIRQYDAGRNVYVRIRNRLYTPRAFKDEYFLASNREWDETPQWLMRRFNRKG